MCYAVAIFNQGQGSVRIFKTKWFSRFACQQSVVDQDLCAAIECAERGLIDADLGGSVIKQRIARPHQAKSEGFRSNIIFQTRECAYFAYGFAKHDRSNISSDELTEFRALTQEMLAYTEAQLQTAISAEKLIEVYCHEKDLQK